MLWKIGDKASHYLSSHKVGKVIDIIYEKPTTWFVGGSPDVKTFLIVEYNTGEKVKITTGDAIKLYE